MFDLQGVALFRREDVVYVPNKFLGVDAQNDCQKLRIMVLNTMQYIRKCVRIIIDYFFSQIASNLCIPLDRVSEVIGVMSKGEKGCPAHFDVDPLFPREEKGIYEHSKTAENDL